MPDILIPALYAFQNAETNAITCLFGKMVINKPSTNVQSYPLVVSCRRAPKKVNPDQVPDSFRAAVQGQPGEFYSLAATTAFVHDKNTDTHTPFQAAALQQAKTRLQTLRSKSVLYSLQQGAAAERLATPRERIIRCIPSRTTITPSALQDLHRNYMRRRAIL